jgi:hypothetical protein
MTTAIAAQSIAGVAIPDTKLAREIQEFVRDTETELLFNHSSRVFYFAALAGKRKELRFDAELLYAGAMFHDMGLMPSQSTANRFEVDSANALHTTPGIPEFMHPVVALLTCGVEMDVLGIAHDQYPDEVRNAVVAQYPRTSNFKEDIIQAFFDGFHKRSDSTFGTVNADVLADKDPKFARGNFCSVIRNSAWR